MQATIARPVELRGRGLHRGRRCRARLLPAAAGSRIVFVRADLPELQPIPADLEMVVGHGRATTLGRGEATVGTVEHLLAALVAKRIDALRVEVDAPEMPVLDGSAAPWLELLERAGRRELASPARVLRPLHRVEVREAGRSAAIRPAERLELAATIEFEHPLVGRQHLELAIEDGAFERELAWARTFGFLEEVHRLRSQGLALGGTLENAVVYGPAGVLNPGGLRAPDEAVRHKLLDVVGDLALLGLRLQGRVETTRPGHHLTHALLRALRSQPEAWEIL